MLTYSSNPHSELNTARWYYHMARTMRRYANKGYGSKSAAARHWNIARARLIRAMTGKPPARPEDADFETDVAGIPCGVVIDDFRPGLPARLFGPPEHCYPEEPPEADFHLVDRTGYAAEWLERKMTARDVSRIEAECVDHMVAMRDV